MNRLSLLLLVLVTALLALAPVAIAQPTDTARSRTAVYRLSSDATYLNSCFDPCDCVTHFASPLQGTMQLTLTSIAITGERVYRVDDVNFRITIGGSEQLVRGSGTYRWYPSLGMLTVLAHRMELDLTIGGGPVQHFDSELIAGASDGLLPPIHIVIDKNNQVCIDEVLTINATPVPASDILTYCLNPDSEAVSGCFPPCLCPLQLQGQLGGSFALVKLPSSEPIISPRPARTDYSVIRVRWSVLSPVAPSTDTIRGSGFYSAQQPTLIEGLERVTLALVRGGQPERLWRYTNTLFTFTGQPPESVRWDLSLNNFFCYDEGLFVRASRCRTPMPGGLLADPTDAPAADEPSAEKQVEAVGPSGSNR